MYDTTVVRLGGVHVTCSLGRLVEPKIEPEIVFGFRTAPRAGAPEFDSYARKCLFLLERTFKNATTTAPAAPAPLVFRFLMHEAPHSAPC